MSLASGSLQGKPKLVEQPLALSYTERNGIVLFQVVRQQHAIPEILLISQFSGGTLYFVSQLLLLCRNKAAGTARPLPFPQPGQTARDKPMNPVLNSPGRVSEKPCRVIGTGALEDIQDNIKPVKVPSLSGPRYFVLNRRDKCVCIWNGYPFHWEQPPIVCSHYIPSTNYAQVLMSLHIDKATETVYECHAG